MCRTLKGCVRNAGQLAAVVGRASIIAEQYPHPSMHARHKGGTTAATVRMVLKTKWGRMADP